jgi:hypothetical protein
MTDITERLRLKTFNGCNRAEPLTELRWRQNLLNAHAHFFLGRCDEAVAWAAMALQEGGDRTPHGSIERFGATYSISRRVIPMSINSMSLRSNVMDRHLWRLRLF